MSEGISKSVMAKSKTKETPLMRQYYAIKKKYPNTILLFRVGDFYETFGEDAIQASRILGITLTKRSNGAASEVELAGFPHHALDNYLPKLIKAGKRVAVCDQLEDPKQAKGIVKRGVTELVTPGLSLNDQVLETKKNNYLCAICKEGEQFGVAFLDISTGEFMSGQGSLAYVEKLLQSFAPAEILFPQPIKKEFPLLFGSEWNVEYLDDWVFTLDFAEDALCRHFEVTTLKGFGVEHLPLGVTAAGAILHYLSITEHHHIAHIRHLARIEAEQYVWLDRFTIRNLELLRPQHENGVALIDVLDETVTPMGGRLLRKWVVLPLKSPEAIRARLLTVKALHADRSLLESLRAHMKPIGDLERLVSKLATGRINPRELRAMAKALCQIQPIKDELAEILAEDHEQSFHQLHSIWQQMDDCRELAGLILKSLIENPPISSTQGGIIAEGVHAELDELRNLMNNGKEYLDKILEREIIRTQIPSLKIGFNKVFGYYLEVTNAHKSKVPNDWIRKQTLANAERYITEELKIYEDKILRAEEQSIELEAQLYRQLVEQALPYIGRIQQTAQALAHLDVLANFAYIAQLYGYHCPEVNDGHTIDIREGRHPVIERSLPIDEHYVPNDLYLDRDTQQILIITGPNMAGKSALLRQTALIVLMAQMGCFVPATHASIGVVDKVFTRVGASDNLAKGESTFMVEMTETASIMNNLSDRSLILMDEIGRGTSTYDGISIAWSIVEYLHNHPLYRPKTLFATHYHELNQLAEHLPRVKNFNVAVKELKDKVIFLRKLQEGGSEHSFGIHVAKMAGMPSGIVRRAEEVLSLLEEEKMHHRKKSKRLTAASPAMQLQIFQAHDPQWEKIKQFLGGLDLNTLTPLEALMKLNELKQMMESE
jgi:DNA mismatch repair protein MutS